MIITSEALAEALLAALHNIVLKVAVAAARVDIIRQTGVLVSGLVPGTVWQAVDTGQCLGGIDLCLRCLDRRGGHQDYREEKEELCEELFM